MLGPLVEGRFAPPKDDDDQTDDDPMLEAVADLATRAVEDRGDFGVALAACRASSFEKPAAERLAPSQTRLARFVLDVAASAEISGNAVRVSAELLSCLTPSDADRAADDDAAFYAARGPTIWSAVDDLRDRVGLCEALRDGCRIFASLGEIKTTSPRVDERALDEMAPDDARDLASLPEGCRDAASKRFCAACVLRPRAAPDRAFAALEIAGRAGLWKAKEQRPGLHAARAARLLRAASTSSIDDAAEDVDAAVADAPDRRPEWLVRACAAGAALRVRRARADDVIDHATAADRALDALARVCRRRASPPKTFDAGFDRFDASSTKTAAAAPGPTDAAKRGWLDAAAEATLARRAARGAAILAACSGQDGRVVAEALDGVHDETQQHVQNPEAAASGLAKRAAAACLRGRRRDDVNGRDVGALADLLEDEDADVLDDLEIFFRNDDDDDAEEMDDHVVVRGARLAAGASTGGAVVAASAAARFALFEDAVARRDNANAVATARRLVRAAAKLDAGPADDEQRNCRDVVASFAVDAAAIGGRLPGGEALSLEALALPAGPRAAELIDAAARRFARTSTRAPLDLAARAIAAAGAASGGGARAAALDAACAYLLERPPDAAAVRAAARVLDQADAALREKYPPAPARGPRPDAGLVAELARRQSGVV